MVMHVTINMGLCACRLLPWKWEMVTVNNCVNLSGEDYCRLLHATVRIKYCMQNHPTSSQLHTSIMLVYILNGAAVPKNLSTCIERNTKRFWQYLFFSASMKAVITHLFSSCCCLFLSLCVPNSCLLLCCCKSPGKQNTCCDHRQLSSYITCTGEWHGTAQWNYTILP